MRRPAQGELPADLAASGESVVRGSTKESGADYYDLPRFILLNRSFAPTTRDGR